MVGSVNKELKDKMVTELSIGIFSFSKKKKYRNIKKLKKEYEYSSRFHSFCCPIIAFGMARSVEYSTWPIYYLHGRFQVWTPPQPQIRAYTNFLKPRTHPVPPHPMIIHFAEQPPPLNATTTKKYCSTSVGHWKFHVIVSKSNSK